MKKLLKSEMCGTLNTEEKSKHAAQEKKKKGRKTRKRVKRKRAVYPNRTYVSPITICNVFFFFFFKIQMYLVYINLLDIQSEVNFCL